MIAFNRREQLASLRPLVVGLQRSGTTVCIDSSVLEGKFSQTASFHYLRGFQPVPGCLPYDCLFHLGDKFSHHL